MWHSSSHTSMQYSWWLTQFRALCSNQPVRSTHTHCLCFFFFNSDLLRSVVSLIFSYFWAGWRPKRAFAIVMARIVRYIEHLQVTVGRATQRWERRGENGGDFDKSWEAHIEVRKYDPQHHRTDAHRSPIDPQIMIYGRVDLSGRSSRADQSPSISPLHALHISDGIYQ